MPLTPLQVDGLHARVVGKLPEWLEGSLYRNGPGRPGVEQGPSGEAAAPCVGNTTYTSALCICGHMA